MKTNPNPHRPYIIMKRYQFTVTPKHNDNQFPMDMLRYDRCYPLTERDAREIERSTELTESRREIVIMLQSNDRSPTADRWDSRGWKVTRSEYMGKI